MSEEKQGFMTILFLNCITGLIYSILFKEKYGNELCLPLDTIQERLKERERQIDTSKKKQGFTAILFLSDIAEQRSVL